MEVQVRPDGRKVWPTELKKRVLSLLDAGRSPAEVSRECQVPIQSIHRWRHEQKKGRHSDYTGKVAEETVPKSEYLKEVTDLQKQIKQLKRSLANMTVERDILKEAVDIATKKKWI